jgi:glycosyltransferase involved in cell wall biosynthesis
MFVPHLRDGGLERHTVILANGLSQHGYDVRLVVLDLSNPDYLHLVDPAVLITGFQAATVRQGYGSIAAYLRETRPTCCISAHYLISSALQVLRTGHRIPTRVIGVQHCDISYTYQQNRHSLWRGHLSPLLRLMIHPRIDHLIAVSEGIRQQMIHNHGFRPDQVTTIHNPIDQTIATRAVPLVGTPELTAPKTGTDIYAVGRLHPVKGLDRLLNAFALCLQQRPALTLHLVGEGPTRNELEQQAAQLGICERVVFHGFSRQVESHYHRASLLVVSSHVESFGSVLIEAMAFGTPVVAFDCDYGPREIIAPGINGFLVPQGDVPGLAAAILRALDYPWDANQIAATTHRFATDHIIDQYIAVIERFL